jgi:hypothetical protein
MTSDKENKTGLNQAARSASMKSDPEKGNSIAAKLPLELNMSVTAPKIPRQPLLTLRSAKIPSVSNMFHNILRRTSVVSSRLYRRIDLSMLRRMHRSGEQSNGISSSPHGALIAKIPQIQTGMLLKAASDGSSGRPRLNPGTLNAPAPVRPPGILGLKSADYLSSSSGTPQNLPRNSGLQNGLEPAVQAGKKTALNRPAAKENKTRQNLGDRVPSPVSGSPEGRIPGRQPRQINEHSIEQFTENPAAQTPDKNAVSSTSSGLKTRLASSDFKKPVAEAEAGAGLFKPESLADSSGFVPNGSLEKSIDSKADFSRGILSKSEAHRINPTPRVSSAKSSIPLTGRKSGEKDSIFRKSQKIQPADAIVPRNNEDISPLIDKKQTRFSTPGKGQVIVPDNSSNSAEQTFQGKTKRTPVSFSSNPAVESAFEAGLINEVKSSGKRIVEFSQNPGDTNAVQSARSEPERKSGPFSRKADDHLTRVSVKTGQTLNPLSESILGRHSVRPNLSPGEISLSRSREMTSRQNITDEFIEGNTDFGQTGYGSDAVSAGHATTEYRRISPAINRSLQYSNDEDSNQLNTQNVLPDSIIKTLDIQSGQKSPGIENRSVSNQTVSNILPGLKPSKDFPVHEGVNSIPEFENNTFTAPTLRGHSAYPMLNLQVISSVRPDKPVEFSPSSGLLRDLSDGPGGIMRSPPFNESSLSPVPANIISGSPSRNHTGVSRQPDSKRNSREVEPDIRVIAEKVFSMLKSELKIERERERHRFLR